MPLPVNPDLPANPDFKELVPPPRKRGRPRREDQHQASTLFKPTLKINEGQVIGVFFSLGTTPDTHNPEMDCAGALVELFGHATKRLRIAIYSLSEPTIVQAIIAAHHRGIETQVVGDKTQGAGRAMKAAIALLVQAGVDIKLAVHQSALMHNKVARVDDDITTTGSFNWTANAENRNDENLVIMRGLEIARAYDRYVMDRIFQKEALVRPRLDGGSDPHPLELQGDRGS